MHTKYFIQNKITIVQKLSNKQTAEVFVGLIDLEQHIARAIKPYEHWKTYRRPRI